MKLLPVLLGVALLVLIAEAETTEGGSNQPAEDFLQEKNAIEKKAPGLWEKIKALGKKFKVKARAYAHDILEKLDKSIS